LTTRNACVIREIAGREEVPVFAGAGHAIMGANVAAEHFHGQSGLGDLKVSPPRVGPTPGRAVRFLIDTLAAAAPRSVSIAVCGPMTNVALALLAEPEITASLGEIVVMGGARSEGGNITASAEYNIYADPHAAAIVFASGAPVVAFGLDATHQVRTTPERMQRLRALKSQRAHAAVELLTFGERVERDLAGRIGAPLHDPCTIAYLIDPSLFKTVACTINVETTSPLTLGHTAVEFRVSAPSPVRWASSADADGVFALLERRLA
jgi:purine nucleosidase